ncbi:ARM repeat-containing protein [Myriangium duriaei CBS 260.36]|uniref:ARM repeat-containing protein n=1 Tax=Myriangium duriaei CBS 260.36 TaxID=1168546 RepID=A0A9P4MG16_9PEZI|nr:ARM repeat-containing protein [Myriangium duriaei CBS 260.36]
MPSFAIEAPGEANPLTESTLLHTLQVASSRDPNQIQSGTKQLQRWEKSDGFYKHLQSVYISRQLPVEVRYLAVIQLKNGIDKYWRKTATNAVNKEDKAVIRSRLISSGVDEGDHRLALQNALVVAKIVRFEYPQDWPDAISNTLDAIRACTSDSSTSRLERSLLILLYIIKELSTARIQRSRTNLQAATPEILAVLGSIYVEKINLWQQMLQQDGHGPQLVSVMSQSLLSIKTLRRLLISGYEHPHRDNDVRQFWELTLNQVQSLMNITHQQSSALPPEIMRLVERHLHQLSKFHLDMADKHPAAFVLLPSSLPLVHAYWSFVKQFSQTYGMTSDVASSNPHGSAKSDTQDDGPSISEKLSLNGLLLIRACIRMAYKPVNTFKYRQPKDKEERKQAETTMKQDLLTQPFVEDIMTVIMTKFLVLRQSDLRDWTEDPEDWVTRQENESEDMNLSVRACSERLVLDLSTHFKATLTGPIMSLFHSVADVQNGDVFFKDAVYAAIGMAAAIFKDDFDFDQLLSTTLIQEIQKQSEGSNILRRRVAIFVGQWVVIKVSPQTRPIVYQMFDHLLQRDDKFNDEVVRITAGHQFKNVVDDFEFDAKQFAPHAESIITKIMALIEEVELTATKLTLLETISALIERFEFRIEPFADRIVNMLPTLWEQSGDEHMMKQSILTVLSRLVQALKQSSGRFHAMLIPIISNAVQSDSEMQIYLLEEALDLWRSILVQTPAPVSPELLSLVQHLFPFYDLASESLRAVLEITESYIVLAPQDMLSDTLRKPLMTKFTSLIGPGAKSEMSGMVCNCMELMITSASILAREAAGEAASGAAVQAAVEAATRQITADMVETGFLPRQLAGLRGAWVAHCTTGPLAKTPTVDGYVETDYFAVLARILWASPTTFIQAIAYTPLAADDSYDIAAPSQESLPAEGNLKWLTEEWFSHQENIGDPARRKLNALALTKLFGTLDRIMLDNLQLMMTLWTDVIMELVEAEPDAEEGAPVALGKDADCLVYTDPVGLRVVEQGAPEEPEEERRRMLKWKDPVHSTGLPKCIRNTLSEVVQACGGEVRFRESVLVNVDREVVAAFGRLGIMG